jgi:glycolate oxidase FAD binding subunit
MRALHDLASSEGGMFELRDGAQVWPAWRRTFASGPLRLRASVFPSNVADTIEVLDRRFVGAAASLSATASAGVIRARLEPSRDARGGALIERAREIAERAGGAVVVDAASPALKRHIDVFGPLRPDFAIMRRLKEEFDPQRVLAPGRFVGRL